MRTIEGKGAVRRSNGDIERRGGIPPHGATPARFSLVEKVG
jgi:hypothetical protein